MPEPLIRIGRVENPLGLYHGQPVRILEVGNALMSWTGLIGRYLGYYPSMSGKSGYTESYYVQREGAFGSAKRVRKLTPEEEAAWRLSG